jgi:hypothetical protein
LQISAGQLQKSFEASRRGEEKVGQKKVERWKRKDGKEREDCMYFGGSSSGCNFLNECSVNLSLVMSATCDQRIGSEGCDNL